MNRHPQTCTRCQGQGGYPQLRMTVGTGVTYGWTVCEHERSMSEHELTDEEEEIARLENEVTEAHLFMNVACGLAFHHGQMMGDHFAYEKETKRLKRQLEQTAALEDTYLDTITDLKRRLAAYEYLGGSSPR